MNNISKEVLEEKFLTSEEKIFYILLKENINKEGSSIILIKDWNERKKYMLRRLKKYNAISGWVESTTKIIVKFNF